MVLVETPAKSTLAEVTTGAEVGREPPVLVVPAVAGHLLLLVLVAVGTLQAGTLVSSMSVLVKQAIRKVANDITISIVGKVTIGVGILEREGLLVQVGLDVRVLEGEREGADVGGPG